MLAKGILGSIALAVMLSLTPIAAADDVSDMRAQMERLQARLDKLEQEKMGTVQKEEMAKMMKEILDDAKAQSGMPKWMENLKFYGDFRLRYQHDHRNGRNGPWGANPPGIGRAKDRNRIRMRLRFGFTKTWWDKQLEVGFRLVTGNATDAGGFWINPDGSDPRSSNQTMTGTFSKKPVWFDLMYAKYKPKWAKGLTVMGGKMKNPIKTRTLMTWDSDVNPEGLVLQYQAPFFGDFKPYTGFGFWILDENAMNPEGDTIRDVIMWSYELGMDWKISDTMAAFFGVTYYQFDHVDSTTYYIATAGVDGQWRNMSNQAAADYKLLEMTTRFDWEMSFLPEMLRKWSIWFSWVHNCADDYSTRKWPGGDRHFQSDPNAYGIGMKVGENKKKGDLSTSFAYLHEEYGSVIAGLSDADFGGPNRKGSVMKVTYNIDDFLTIGMAMWMTDPIHTNDRNLNFSNHNIDKTTSIQLDLVWKF